MTEVHDEARSPEGVLTLDRPVPRFTPADATLWVVLVVLLGAVLAIVAGIVVTPVAGIVLGLATLAVVVGIVLDTRSRSANPTFRALRPGDVAAGQWVVLTGSRTRVARVRSVHADRLVLDVGGTVRSEQLGRASHVWASPTPPRAGSFSVVPERDPSAAERVAAQRDERRRARSAESDGTGDVYNDGGGAAD